MGNTYMQQPNPVSTPHHRIGLHTHTQRRSPKSRRFPHAGLCSLLVFLSAALAGEPAMASEVLPFDLAFGHARQAFDERPAISSDGNFVAYVVHTPPEKSPVAVGY